ADIVSTRHFERAIQRTRDACPCLERNKRDTRVMRRLQRLLGRVVDDAQLPVRINLRNNRIDSLPEPCWSGVSGGHQDANARLVVPRGDLSGKPFRWWSLSGQLGQKAAIF